MSIMTALRDILNNTPGTATNIQYNFQVVEDYINSSVVTTDGQNAMTGNLVINVPPVADTHAATKGYVDGLWLPGMIVDYAGVAPLAAPVAAEWAFCDGSTQSTGDTKFAALFAVIQYRYGGSGGSFNLPDFRGKVAVGRSDLAGDAAFVAVGNTGGKRDSELLIHQHTVPIHGHGFTGSSNQVDLWHQHPVTGGLTGSAGTHTHNIGAGSQLFYVQAGAFDGTPGPGTAGRSGGWVDAPNHQHTIDVNSGGPLSDGGRFHTHNTGTYAVSDKPAFDTVGSAAAGTTLTDKNLPPYVVTNRIIKL